MAEVYHEGEREIQQKVGERHIADRNGAVITNMIIKGAINFIEKQPMAVVSSSNNEKELWISLLIGDFGFTKVPHPNAIVFNKEKIKSHSDDIFYKNISLNPSIGSLFIELDTRRRFRINGECKQNENKIEVTIKESYPNCPKYIQKRVIEMPEYFKQTNAAIIEGNILSDIEKKWISEADTMFVGSSSNGKNLDASHRGGNPGFIELLDDITLKIPDYSGNSLYNTFGNIVQNPHVGLLFIDFEKRQTLQLTGKGSLLFNQNSSTDIQKTGGTGRYWLFETSRWIKTENHHMVNWQFLEYSPFNPQS